MNAEALYEQLEADWARGAPRCLADYLAGADLPPADRRAALLELVKIDLEHRWRSGDAPRWKLEDYAERHGELRPAAELPLDLVAEEYRDRRRFGDDPQHDEYLARFPGREDLGRALAEVDDALRDEFSFYHPAAASHPPSPAAPEHDPRAPLPPGDYLLQKHLGSGGMGKVYRALQRSLNKPVAIKVLKKALRRTPGAIERFLEEGRAVARLRHPGIVDVHGMGCFPGGAYFLVMDLVQGTDLGRQLERGPAPPDQAARWVAEVAAVVQHAHEAGVIHCDLKPGNLLLADDGRVLLTDFGLARSLAAEDPAAVEIAGTAGYMAPEQADPTRGPLGPATDVYGLGAVLYALLTGRAPFEGRTLPDVVAQVVSSAAPPRPASLRAGIPEPLEELCLACLAKPPAERPQSARAVGEALRGR